MRCNAYVCCSVVLVAVVFTFVSLPFIFQRDSRPHVVLKREQNANNYRSTWAMCVEHHSKALVEYYSYPLDFFVATHRVVDYLEKIQKLDEKFKTIINADPFADLYSRVRPTYDAFISTKNQVGIYEKMERIPGGPTNFMQTALKVVEETQKKIHEFETEYRLIVARTSKKYTRLREEFDSLLNTFELVFDDRDDETLNSLGVLLDGNTDLEISSNERGQTVQQVLQDLVELFEKRESLDEELRTVVSELNIQTPEDFEGTKAAPLADEVFAIELLIQQIIEESGSLIATVIPRIEGAVKGFGKAMGDSLEGFDKSKTRYEKIVDGLDQDVMNVRKRIEDLKVYRKREEF